MIQNGYDGRVRAKARAAVKRLDAGLWVALLALVLRLLPWRAVFTPAGTLFVDIDDWNHLRRMLVAARDWPLVPTLDRYFAHPDGFLTNWPCGHDWLAAIPIKLAWLVTGESVETAARVAAFLPVLYGAATAYLLWRLARRFLDERAALFAGFLAAVLPSPLFYSCLGRPDHHCAETFWFLLAVELLTVSPFAAAAALALGWMNWSGFVAFEGLVFLWFLWEDRQDGWKVFAAQIPVLLVFTAANPFVLSGSVGFDVPSLFQPWLAFIFALSLLARERRSEMLGVGAAGSALPFLWLSLPSLAAFAFHPPNVFHLFTELQPSLKPYGRWDFTAPLPWLGLVPLAVPWLLWDLFRRRGNSSVGRLALLFSLSFVLLAMMQSRYVLHASFAVSLLLASSLDAFKAPFAVCASVALLLLSPALKNSAGLPFATEQLTGNPELRIAADWLRENTPKTRSRDRDEGVPEYGVFADSNLGPLVAAVGERPAAGTNNHAMKDMLSWTIQLFLREDGRQVSKTLKSKGYRYVFLDSMNEGGRYLTYYGLTAVPMEYWAAKREKVAFYRLFQGKSDADLKGFSLAYETPGKSVKIFRIID